MRIKAAPKRLVRDPATMEPLPDDGITVEDDDLYWARALRDGDVVVLPEEDKPAHKPKAGSSKEEQA